VNKKLRAYIFLVIIWALLVAALFFIFQPRAQFLEVDFLDVGQGDAIFIKTPFGQNVLIDGGPSRSVVVQEISKVLPFWDRKIDLVILTHPHSDHFIGLPEVFKRYQIENIIIGSASSMDEDYLYFLESARAETPNLKNAPATEKIIFGDNCVLEIFNPEFFGAPNDANEMSLVAELDCGAKFLFMGDAGQEAEKVLLKNNLIEDIDILKVGHHGSNSASSLEFLDVARPEEAIIQVGADNYYGLPSDEALYRIKKADAEILRTDFNGLIRMKSENGELTIKTEK
jgi:competence protein ComEC